MTSSSLFTATTSWQRFSWTTTVNAGTNYVNFYPIRIASATYNGTTFHVWGAQLEPFATMGDYVANVTQRSNTGKQNAFRWYNPTVSTVYGEGNINGLFSSGGYNPLFELSNGTYYDSVMSTRSGTSSAVYNDIYLSNVKQAFGSFTMTQGSVFKNALRFGANDVQGYGLNASNVSTNHLTDTSSTTPPVTHLALGFETAGQNRQTNGHIRKFVYWPVGLTNGELSSLTQP